MKRCVFYNKKLVMIEDGPRFISAMKDTMTTWEFVLNYLGAARTHAVGPNEPNEKEIEPNGTSTNTSG